MHVSLGGPIGGMVLGLHELGSSSLGQLVVCVVEEEEGGSSNKKSKQKNAV